MRLAPILRPAARLAAVALVLVAGGCEDGVDPTLGTEQAFSLYGYLDPTADRQALRVVPVGRSIGADTARTLDAVVTSVELGSGREVAWRDSVVAFGDGSRAHVFVADYTPPAGTTVEVRVTETTGERRTTTVRTSLPRLTRIAVGNGVRDRSDVLYPIRVDDAERVLASSLVFYVTGVPPSLADTVALPYDAPPPLAEVGPGTWGLDLPFIETARAFLASPEVAGFQLRLVEVGVRAFVANAEWDSGGLDDDALVEPGTFSNVTGGFGYVGAGFWSTARWIPSLTTQSRAGFVVDADPASLLVINEVSAEGWVELFNPTQEDISVSGYEVRTPGGAIGIPVSTVVPARGFYLTAGGRALTSGPFALATPGGAVVVEAAVASLPEPVFGTYGSYPDGRSRPIRGVDIFRGQLAPTPGEPNDPGFRLVDINEVYTAGTDGWVEVTRRSPEVAGVRVTTDPGASLSDWAEVEFTTAFGTASETPLVLELPQGGAEVFVFAYLVPVGAPPVLERVWDVRTYGPQSPATSAGLLPDRDRGSWRDGLLPTRGSPNASGARHTARRPSFSPIDSGRARRPSSAPRP